MNVIKLVQETLLFPLSHLVITVIAEGKDDIWLSDVLSFLDKGRYNNNKSKYYYDPRGECC